jgi:hypothetical protein
MTIKPTAAVLKTTGQFKWNSAQKPTGNFLQPLLFLY